MNSAPIYMHRHPALIVRPLRPRPLGSLNAAMRDLDLDADNVRALIDSSTLISFNISSRGTKRVELRVLTKSIEHYNATGNRLDIAWPEIFKLILPSEKLLLTGLDIQRSLNCDEGLASALIRSGCIFCAKKGHPGRNGSPVVARYSFEEFMKGRLL